MASISLNESSMPKTSMNLISQHIQELDDNFLPQELVEKSYTTIYRQVRTSHLSLVEKIIGEVRGRKKKSKDGNEYNNVNGLGQYNSALESFALLLEQGLEELKDNK